MGVSELEEEDFQTHPRCKFAVLNLLRASVCLMQEVEAQEELLNVSGFAK